MCEFHSALSFSPRLLHTFLVDRSKHEDGAVCTTAVGAKCLAKGGTWALHKHQEGEVCVPNQAEKFKVRFMYTGQLVLTLLGLRKYLKGGWRKASFRVSRDDSTHINLLDQTPAPSEWMKTIAGLGGGTATLGVSYRCLFLDSLLALGGTCSGLVLWGVQRLSTLRAL